MRHLTATLLLVCLAHAGCVSDPLAPDAEPPGGAASLPGAGEWPYWPVRMRVHPLSRLVVAEDGTILVEARLEFLDRDEMTSRAFGQVRLEVHDETGPRLVNGERSWNVDLRQLPENSRRFDEVIRTYLFRLRTDWKEMPASSELHAWYLGHDGIQLRDRHRLRGAGS